MTCSSHNLLKLKKSFRNPNNAHIRAMQSALEGNVNGFAHTLQFYSTHFYFLIIV
jgi:hypothetical protein